MTTFGYFITRKLSAAETDELRARLKALGAELPADTLTLPMPGIGDNGGAQPPSTGTGNMLNGDVSYGDVTIHWVDGVPLDAWRNESPDQRIGVPGQFWADVTQNAGQDQWASFAYIAFLESGYDAGADVVDTNGKRSRGYFQVNGVWPQYDSEAMFIGPENVRAAQFIYDQQGYGAWWNSAGILGLPR